MLTAYLFDDRVGESVSDWESSLPNLAENHVLWLDASAPTEDESGRVRDAFDLRDEDPRLLSASLARPQLTQHETYIRVTAVAPPTPERDGGRGAVVECFVGVNWVITVHAEELAVIDDFREVAAGSGELGALDSATFLATLLEWVITSYSRAFEEVELTLEKFDTEVLNDADRNVEREVRLLVEARQRVGMLRRGLEPHRELFAALGHAEFDRVSTEASARRFNHLEQRVESGLASARDVKDSVVSSFDMLILRTEQRTSGIVKVLTLTSILLMPGALIAGLMGMNVNLTPTDFFDSGLFWLVIVAVTVIAGTTVVLARLRHWI